jgi:hypothetical protein
VQPEWIGTISALAGATVAGGVAIVRETLAERRQAVRDENQRRHEIEEARFASRRDAYVSFAAACQKTITQTDEFENKHQVSPGDMGYDGPHRGVIDTLDLVLIIGPNARAKGRQEWRLECAGTDCGNFPRFFGGTE